MAPPNPSPSTGGAADPRGRTGTRPERDQPEAGDATEQDRGGRDDEGGEDEVVARIALAMARASGPPPVGDVWIGDDAAVLGVPEGRLLLATDTAVGGVHADLSLVGLDDLGWKGLTATVSDVGAMGGRPLHAVVSLGVPPGTDVDLLATGIAEASARWACPVVGGDLTSADQVVVAVTATGALVGDGPAVTRGGASPGDRLVVTGPLGASAAGLRLLREAAVPTRQAVLPTAAAGAALQAAHRRPLARIDEGVEARLAGATAMIDVSDGLAIDLHRLADASGVGFRLESVPVADGAAEDEALAGGEDYELVIAVPGGRLRQLEAAFARAGLRAPLPLGTCDADPAVRVLRGRPLPRSGWQHRLLVPPVPGSGRPGLRERGASTPYGPRHGESR